MYVAVSSAGVSELSRVPPAGAEHERHVRRTTAVATIAAATLVVLVVVPDRLGRVAIGDVWDAAEPLLVPAGVQIVFIGLAAGMRAGLLGVRAIGTVMWLDLAVGALLLAAITLGLAVAGRADGVLVPGPCPGRRGGVHLGGLPLPGGIPDRQDPHATSC